MFQFERNRSPQGLLLAQKFWDYLTLEVGMTPQTANQRELALEWAGEFDSFFNRHSPDHVCAVFNFYVEQWRKKRGIEDMRATCLSPKVFMDNFVYYERQYQWNLRPINESDLMEILKPLRRERWEVDWELVVTAVSQSLDNVRRFCSGLDSAKLPERVKRWIRGMVGPMGGYVLKHFRQWRIQQSPSVWRAIITIDSLLSAAYAHLVRSGFSMGHSQQYIGELRRVIEEKQACRV